MSMICECCKSNPVTIIIATREEYDIRKYCWACASYLDKFLDDFTATKWIEVFGKMYYEVEEDKT